MRIASPLSSAEIHRRGRMNAAISGCLKQLPLSSGPDDSKAIMLIIFYHHSSKHATLILPKYSAKTVKNFYKFPQHAKTAPPENRRGSFFFDFWHPGWYDGAGRDEYGKICDPES